MDLWRYQRLTKELETKRRLLTALRDQTVPMLQDSVKGSLSHFPYSQATIHIEGRADGSTCEAEISSLTREIEDLRLKVQDAQHELLEYIDGMKDNKKQTIVRCKCFFGFSTQRTAEIVGFDPSYINKILKDLT